MVAIFTLCSAGRNKKAPLDGAFEEYIINNV